MIVIYRETGSLVVCTQVVPARYANRCDMWYKRKEDFSLGSWKDGVDR